MGLRSFSVLLITLVILALLVNRLAGDGALWNSLAGMDPAWIWGAVGVATFNVLLSVTRWQVILEAQGHPLRYGRALYSMMATYPLIVVTPSRANEFLRAYAVREVVPVYSCTSSILAEKVVDLLILFLLGAVGSAMHGFWAGAALMLAGALAEIAVIVAILRAKGWLVSLPFFKSRSEKIDQLLSAFESLRRAPIQLVKLCACSLIIRLGVVWMGYALLLATGATIDFGVVFATWPVAVLVGLLPITLAGMGTRDAAFVYLMHRMGAAVTDAQVLASTLAYSAITFVLFALVGLPFMVREGMRRRTSS